MNTKYELYGSSGTTVRSDTHWFRVEMRGTSYRITDWYMPDSEFDREVRGVLTEQDFKDAENAPLKNRYLVKQAELLLPYLNTGIVSQKQDEPKKPVELTGINSERTAGMLIIRNLTDRTSGYTPRICIRKDGKELPHIREDAGWEEIWAELDAGEERHILVNWGNVYGALESGTYTLYLDAESFRDYPVEFSIPFP